MLLPCRISTAEITPGLGQGLWHCEAPESCSILVPLTHWNPQQARRTPWFLSRCTQVCHWSGALLCLARRGCGGKGQSWELWNVPPRVTVRGLVSLAGCSALDTEPSSSPQLLILLQQEWSCLGSAVLGEIQRESPLLLSFHLLQAGN